MKGKKYSYRLIENTLHLSVQNQMKMSEYLQSSKSQALILAAFTLELMEAKTNKAGVEKMHEMLVDAGPRVFISAVDQVVEQKGVTTAVKKGINKMLNVFYTHLNSLPQPEIKKGSFLDQIIRDNEEINKHVRDFRPVIKKVQKQDVPQEERDEILKNLSVLQNIEKHYQVMENIVFPFLERQWPDHRCLQVLWSVHDDVRREIGEMEKLFAPGKWDLKRFNRLTGDFFFDVKTVIFREEKIVIPAIVEAGLADILDEHLEEVAETGWSFIELQLPEKKTKEEKPATGLSDIVLNFSTGKLTGEQIDLIFKHLPVDITFVDENDEVRYFSDPPKRTFARTPAVIGRTVQNCHPPESVWMVEKILDAFKKGKQDVAAFWIPFKNMFVYIQYFAVRDKNGKYRGTIEVTQDVKEIRELEGERKLLSWGDE